MAATERPADRGSRLGVRLGTALGEELRRGRVAAGLSQVEVARACGLSHSAISRLERGNLLSVGIREVSTALAVVGLELSTRVYPAGRPHRDRAHAGLLERLRLRLPSDIGWRAEVPFPDSGDLRAWDAMVRPMRLRVAIEAETPTTRWPGAAAAPRSKARGWHGRPADPAAVGHPLQPRLPT